MHHGQHGGRAACFASRSELDRLGELTPPPQSDLIASRCEPDRLGELTPPPQSDLIAGQQGLTLVKPATELGLNRKAREARTYWLTPPRGP